MSDPSSPPPPRLPPPPPPPSVKKAPPPPPAATTIVKEAPPPPPSVKKAPPPPAATTIVKEAPPPPPSVKKAPPPPPAAAAATIVKEVLPHPPSTVSTIELKQRLSEKSLHQEPPSFPISTAKQANFVPPVSWELKRVGGRLVPEILSAVAMTSAGLSGPSSPFEPSTVAALEDDEDTIEGVVSPRHPNRQQGQNELLDGHLNTSSPSPIGNENVLNNNNDTESPVSSEKVRDNLLRLLERLASCGEKSSSIPVPSSPNDIKNQRRNLQSYDVDSYEVLDDLFLHLLSVLEKVVRKFVRRSMDRKWEEKVFKGKKEQFSPLKEVPRLWLLAWQQAQHNDDEAWLEWKSALCRSWRRIKRESASRERSEALNAAIFRLDPTIALSRRYNLKLSCDNTDKYHNEQQKVMEKLHKLLYRVFCTCPVLLLDEQTQYLARVAKVDLEFVRQYVVKPVEEDDYEEDITSFISNLNRKKKNTVIDSDLSSLEEVERLFAAKRYALLCRYDAGEPPPSSVSSMLIPSVSCSPQRESLMLQVPYSPPPRYVDPIPAQLRPQRISSLSWSPVLYDREAVEESLAARLTSSKDYSITPPTKHDEHMRRNTSKSREAFELNGQNVIQQQNNMRGTNTSLSPHPFSGNATHLTRRLPSTIRTPRSVSSW